MKIPCRTISLRNVLVSLHKGHLKKYPAVRALFCKHNLWNQESDRQHGNWIDSIALYLPICSVHIGQVSVGVWHLTGFFILRWFEQNDWNRPTNSKRQPCSKPHDKWKDLRQESSQQLILAPVFLQNVQR